MATRSKAVLLSAALLLVVLLAFASSSPYHLHRWMVKEHLSPYDSKEICMGNSADNMVCMTRDDMKLFKDKHFGPDKLCLGDPQVCINSGHLKNVIAGPAQPACINKWTPWNDVGDGKFAFLGRHDVICADGERLVQHRWLVDVPGNKARISYKCCK
jgi:hypothetical protein